VGCVSVRETDSMFFQFGSTHGVRLRLLEYFGLVRDRVLLFVEIACDRPSSSTSQGERSYAFFSPNFATAFSAEICALDSPGLVLGTSGNYFCRRLAPGFLGTFNGCGASESPLLAQSAREKWGTRCRRENALPRYFRSRDSWGPSTARVVRYAKHSLRSG
jgi:hypothetical protein